MADPWQPASFNLKLPGWAQVPGNLVKGLERADQQKRAIGILTGQEPESWVQRAAMSDPANWMAAPSPVSQGWRGIYGLAETAPGQTDKAAKAVQNVQAPVAVLSDDVNARASEARRMLQQATPYWEREENQAIRAAAAEGGGPRAGEAGYAQRADIQAWMDAQRAKGPAGEAMVNRFIEQQKKRGLFEAPKPTPMVDQLAAPFDQREIAAMGYQGVKTEPQAMAGATAVQGVAPTADPRFEDPAYAAEVLRGAPVSPVSAIAGNEEQRAAAARGYSQAPAGEAFSAPVTLPNTAFVGNGMPQGVAMTPDRAQGVPGITDPLPAPEDTRDLNLNGEDALIRRYLSAIKGQ